MVTRLLEARKYLRSGLRLMLWVGPMAARAQGLGAGEGGASDGSEGLFIDALFCLGLPLVLFGSLFFWIRFKVQSAKGATGSRAQRSSRASRRSEDVPPRE